MSYKAFQYDNDNSSFVSGISIPKVEGSVFDFQVNVCNAKVPLSWIDVDYSISDRDTSYYIEFRRPCNSVHFRIEICGAFVSVLNPIFHLSPSRSQEEALALMKGKSMVFVGCARNCAAKVEAAIKILTRLGDLFASYKIVIFENDSNDGTDKLLENFASSGAISLIKLDNLDSSLPMRTQRLSFARNLLLRQVQSITPDYFSVVDLDGVLGGNFDVDGFVSNFKREECWDAVFPANANFYYDVWALRHPDICPGDYMKRMDSLSPALGRENIFNLCLRSMSGVKFTNLTGWLPVDSAFGGIGLYKYNSFKNSSYFGYTNGNEVCEHVVFHEKAKAAGMSLYINPTFIVNSEFL